MKYVQVKSILSVVFLFLFWNGALSVTAQSKDSKNTINHQSFPEELVNFTSYPKNPVFSGTGENTWDQVIRERGWILLEDGVYHMWYTGYTSPSGQDTESHLGYATSTDGLKWTRYNGNPIYDSCMVEDMCVIKSKGTYYMFAEGREDMAHLLTSSDRIHWKEQGRLDIRYRNGKPLTQGSYGTPSVWLEDGTWYLFYERDDLGIWLATSPNLKIWTNIQDEPVIQMGPELYDKYAVAVDQVIKYQGSYYAYYHATEFKDWHEWTTCIAKSGDLLHWEKYAKNPILRENKSSAITVFDGDVYRLYTMHAKVCVHFPRKTVRRK